MPSEDLRSRSGTPATEPPTPSHGGTDAMLAAGTRRRRVAPECENPSSVAARLYCRDMKTAGPTKTHREHTLWHTVAAVTAPVSNVMAPYAKLEDKGRKARYGVSYVRNVCSQAGVPFSETEPDSDVFAVDCQAEFPESPVRIQVKCTSTKKLSGHSASWRLDEGWVRKWDASKIPVYFVLVIVPPRWDQWLAHDPQGTMHASVAYWRRVDFGVPMTGQLKIDKTNRLTRDTLAVWHADLLEVFSNVGSANV